MSIINIKISPFDYVNFSCKKGDAFEKSLEVLNEDGTEYDFTGYTAKMQLRKKEGVEPEEEFTTEDNSIFMEEGVISLNKTSIDGEAGKYLFDLQITKDGRNKTIISGEFTIYPDYTL